MPFLLVGTMASIKSKSNIQSGEVVMVQDFAQNYLCNLQNEPQAIYWLHKQATLHLTVVHYKCPVDDCHTVTHEVVQISNDLKHDAHLVEKFHHTTMKVLKDHYGQVHKIIKFTDHRSGTMQCLYWPCETGHGEISKKWNL